MNFNTCFDIYGERMCNKEDKTMRIGFQNFNGLSSKENDPVDDSLQLWINEKEFDIFGVSEINLYWPLVNRNLQFRERMNKWWQQGHYRAVMDFNRVEKRVRMRVRPIER